MVSTTALNVLQFKCQNCHLPLIINDSLLNLSAAQQRLLTSDKSFAKNDNNNSPESDTKQLPDDSNNVEDEKLRLYNEAMSQAQDQSDTPVLDTNIILHNHSHSHSSRSPTAKDLANTEDKLLDQLAELQLNLDELDDDKLLEIILKFETQDQDEAADSNSNTGNFLFNKHLDLNIHDEFENPNQIISNRINSLTKIFNILSFKYDIDYPICMECSETLLAQLKLQYETSMKEKNSYLQFLNKLNKQSSPDLTKLDTSLAELQKLNQKYSDSISEIKNLELEESQLKNDIASINKEIALINSKEADLLTKKNLYELELTELNELNNQTFNNLQQKLEINEKLKNSNVFNDVFNISYDGPFGTINGLRLGNLKNCKISWLEINSALGHIVLLLSIIIKKLGLNIKGYKLVPMGSYSKIEKYEPIPTVTTTGLSNNENNNSSAETQQQQRQHQQFKKVTFELYSSGQTTIERLFTNSTLDQAMIALLNIIKQIEDQLKHKYDNSIELPYVINLNNNKIGGLNIKLNRKITDSEWTMACKFLITDVKYILAFSSY